MQNNEWMLDVLQDLRRFAARKSLLELAEHLDDAMLIAASELRSLQKEKGFSNHYVPKVGKHPDSPRDGKFV